MLPPAKNSIPAGGRWLRLGLAVSILLVLGFAALPPMGSHPPFLTCAFHAISGLPCLFCGGTRAARAILHGNPGVALYFNALAFPAIATVAAAFVVLLVEAAAGRPIALRETLLRRLNRFVPALLFLALVWWIFHVYAALRTPKPELVNLGNPIAAWARAIVENGRR